MAAKRPRVYEDEIRRKGRYSVSNSKRDKGDAEHELPLIQYQFKGDDLLLCPVTSDLTRSRMSIHRYSSEIEIHIDIER